MLTEKDYCDYNTCVALRELGYNAPQRLIPDYFGVFEEPQYDEKIHLYDAQKWLREEKGMLLQPTYLELSDEWICVIRDKNKRHTYSAQKQKNYEDALSEGVRASIKILQDEQKENN